ncbi:MAG: thermonuclease family protein [Anaerolineae bacterium]|nr:thermonuclease family protein [Anaerolineae bacterium]
MALPNRILVIMLIAFLSTLACAGAETPPENTPTPLPVSTSTALPVSTPTPLPDAGPSQPNDGFETVAVARVVDGDTIELVDGRRVRYIGINTPERGQPYYNEASEVNGQLVNGRQVQLEFDQDTFDQYGRTLAYIWADGVMVNREIIVRGYANAFTVPPNVKYSDAFRQAEQEAREAGRGLWAGSETPLKIISIQADAPGDDRENPNGEWIEIANEGSEGVNMAGYTLKDEANHIYTFGNFTLDGGSHFRLYSGQGQNTAAELYWGLIGESVWNNGSDAAFLRDNQGALVDSYIY